MPGSRILDDVPVGVRTKISALWIAMLFLFAYGDIFGFFVPGRLEEIIRGEVSGIEITDVFLFAVSIYVVIASLMIFLTLLLKPAVSRWLNVVLPILFIASIVGSAFGEGAYYWFLSIVESALLVLVIGYAWRWPTRTNP
jgi:Family of unknown function (DUF6326)